MDGIRRIMGRLAGGGQEAGPEADDTVTREHGGGVLYVIAGGAFAVVLSITERRQRLEDLSLWRTTLWGGLGGFPVAACFNLFGGSGGLIWSSVATMAFSGAV